MSTSAKKLHWAIVKLFGLPATTQTATITLELGKYPKVICEHIIMEDMVAICESTGTLQALNEQSDPMGR